MKKIIYIYGPQGSGKTTLLRYFNDVIFRDQHNLFVDVDTDNKDKKVNQGWKGVNVLVDGFDETKHNAFLSSCNQENQIILSSQFPPSPELLAFYQPICLKLAIYAA